MPSGASKFKFWVGWHDPEYSKGVIEFGSARPSSIQGRATKTLRGKYSQLLPMDDMVVPRREENIAVKSVGSVTAKGKTKKTPVKVRSEYFRHGQF